MISINIITTIFINLLQKNIDDDSPDSYRSSYKLRTERRWSSVSNFNICNTLAM